MISICQSSIFKSVLFSAIIFVGFILQVQLTSAFGTQESTEIDSTDNNLDGGFTQKVTSFTDGSVVVTNHFNDGSQDFISYDASTDTTVIKRFPASTHGSQDASDDIPSLPDLIPIDIILEPKDIGGVASPDNMEAGRYKPFVTITNNSCLPTNYKTSMQNKIWSLSGDNCMWQKDNVFINAGSLGKGGSFPAQLRIDFNSDGTWDYNEFVYSIGPLRAARAKTGLYNPATMPETVVVKFPNVTLPNGNHTIEVRVDPKSGAGSCDPGGDDGCIIERTKWNGRTWGSGNEANNNLSESLRVREPNINLGSYILNSNNLDKPGSESMQDRTIDSGDLIGLFWRGPSVDFSTCVGTTVTSKGKVLTGGFTGEQWPNTNYTPRFLTSAVNARNYDRTVKEPNVGIENTYTISCETVVFGKTVTDSIRICGDGCSPPNPPVITGATATELGTKETFNFSATDPDDQNVRVLVDWDRDGTIDQYLPRDGSYFRSGNSRNAGHTWTSLGSHTFRARTEDETGLLSGWATHTITISQPAVPPSLICDEPDANNFGDPLPCIFPQPPTDNDGDGVPNDDENNPPDGEPPTDPTDPCDFIASDITMSVTYTGSCGALPPNDTDGDGVTDPDENNPPDGEPPTDPTDPCDFIASDITMSVTYTGSCGTPLTCDSFDYTWGACIGGVETQTVSQSYPAGCVGGSPTPQTRSCGAPPPDPQCSNSPVDDDGDTLVDAADPGCWTDPTDPSTYDPNDNSETHTVTGAPEITVSKPVVRTGQPVTVSWVPNGHACVPSSNLPIAAAAGVTAADGSETVIVSSMTTYYIECGGVIYDVTVFALPEMQET